MQLQAADESEQDDFFLASDDEGPAAAGDRMAGDAPDAAAFERATHAAGAVQPTALKGAKAQAPHVCARSTAQG
jgi:hypothetical protein